MSFKIASHRCALCASLLGFSSLSYATVETSLGNFNANFNLRYASISEDNARLDADALTLRAQITFQTKEISGFSAVVEFEGTQALIDDYNDTIGSGSEFSVEPDPEMNELDQAFVQYKSDKLKARLGRQVITFDNHRFIGSVPWRQDKQTFDAFSVVYSADDYTATYAYINKRNRIFANERDLDSKDHFLHVNMPTEYGTLSAYGYLLEVDNQTTNSLDTWGARLTGQKDVGDTAVNYTVEIAHQTSEANLFEYEAMYYLFETSVPVSRFRLKLGYELLGSDSGDYGFSTPLSTLHAFNGWADLFLATPAAGLEDVYINLSGKAWDGNWSIIYHTYRSDDDLALSNDLGDEINAIYTKKLSDKFSFGAKVASYFSNDDNLNKVDTDKAWVWLTMKF